MGHDQRREHDDDVLQEYEYEEKHLWSKMWENWHYVTYVLQQFSQEEKSNENHLVQNGMSFLYHAWRTGWSEYDDWHHQMLENLHDTENIADKKHMKHIYERDKNVFRARKFGNFAAMLSGQSESGRQLQNNIFHKENHHASFHDGSFPKWEEYMNRTRSLCNNLQNLHLHCAHLAEHAG